MVDLGKPLRRANSWLLSTRSRARKHASRSRPRANAVTKWRSALALGVARGRLEVLMPRFCTAEAQSAIGMTDEGANPQRLQRGTWVTGAPAFIYGLTLVRPAMQNW